MDKLVFINSNALSEEPYTTSRIISEYGGQKHRAIRQLIKTYINKFQKLGRVTFEMTPLKTKGGFQNVKIYKINEQQATFLITLMKNTEKVVNFKFELTKQFYEMRNQLIKRRIERSDGKKERTTLTDAISRLPDGKYKEHLYSNITRLIYKILFNKTILQLKEQFNVPKKGNLRDYLPQVQLAKVKVLEERTSVLIDMGLPYEEIKLILNKYAKN
jgi:phage regulator Rha-like protein